MAAIRLGNLIKGGSFDDPSDLALWTQVSQAWEIFTTNNTGTDPFDGVGSAKPTDASSGTAELAQVNPLSDVGATDDEVDNGLIDIDFYGYHAGDSSDSDNQRMIVEALDAVDSVISTLYDSGTVDTGDNNWKILKATASVPSGTRKIKVRLLGTKASGSSGFNSYFDNIACYAIRRDRFSRQVELSRDLVYRNTFDFETSTEPELAKGRSQGTFGGTAGRTGLGRYGQAYISNSAGDSLTTPDYPDVRTDPTSVSAWVYLNALPSSMAFGSAPRKIAAKGNGTSSGWFLGVLSGDTLVFRVVDAALSTYTASYTLVGGDVGRWVHVVGTQDGSDIKIYIDGVLQDTQLVAGALQHDASPVEVGLDWDGRIDDVRVWNKVLVTSNADGINEIEESSRPYGGPDTTDVSFAVPEFNTLDPDGVNGAGLTVPHDTSLNPATGGFTVEALVEIVPAGASAQRIVTKDSDAGFTAWSMQMGTTADSLGFTFRPSSTEIVTVSANPDVAVPKEDVPDGWIRVTAVRTGDSRVQLYFNGDIVDEVTTTGTDNETNTEDVGIGMRAATGVEGTEPYSGGVADVRFWDIARTRQQIRAARGYNEADRDDPGLVSIWLLNEGAGTVGADTVGSNDGSGTPTWGVKLFEDNSLQYDDTMTLSWWWNNFSPDVTDKYLVAGLSGAASRNPTLPQGQWDVQSFASADILCLAHDPTNDIWAAGASDGHIWTSEDYGATWVDQGDVGSTNAIRGLFWSNGMFIAVGDAGMILTSMDSISWSTRTSGTTENLFDVTRVEDTWIATGSNGTVLTATNLNSWSASTYPHSGVIRGVAWNLVREVGNQSIIAVGDAGEMAASTDKGATWTSVTSGLPATQINAVHHFQGTWVLVGESGLLAYREDFNGDGSWSTVVSGAPAGLNDVHHALFDGRWIIGGDDNFFLTSGDGQNWSTESTGLAGTDDIFAVHSKEGTGLVGSETTSILSLDTTEQYNISFDQDLNGLDYTDSPFQIIVLPINPNPNITDASLDCDTDVLDATVSLGISDGNYSTYYWEVEMVPDQAFLRIEETGPVSLPIDPSTVELTFTQPESIDIQGKRIRFVIVPQQLCGSVLWVSPWITLNTCDGDGGTPGPGPDENVFAPVIFNIYLNQGFDEFRRYSLEREPDIDTSSAEDFFWGCVQIDPDDECGPAPVDPRQRKLILKNLPAGRFRYRFTAQFTDKTVYQDFILFVRPDSDEDNY